MDYISLQSCLRPEAVALADLATEREWTYRQLDRFVARAASYLAETGVEHGDRVACLSRNCAEIVVLHHACVRIGAIFVPLNWRLSASELGFLIDDCQPRLLFGDSQASEVGFEHDSIDELAGQCSSVQPMPECQIDPDWPSLILYTSGTTGRPKGAILSERNLAETAINSTTLCEVTSKSTFLCDAPMFHVIGLVTNVWPVLLNGGRVLVSDAFVPERTLGRLMDPNLGVTHYFCVPQMAGALRQEKNFDPSRLGHITAIFTGGAPHPEVQIKTWLKDGVRIVDGFGMSETGTVFGMPVEPAVIDSKAGCVGVPTPRVKARLVDAENNEIDSGNAGELQLRGDNVFGGYWGLDNESRASFTADGWFRTGDIATRDADGFYRIVGRRKDMYISGGENVYPAEVEAVASECAAVAECAVVGVPDERWGEVGFLFVVERPGAEFDKHCLMNLFEQKLARYKIPRHVSTIEALPRNGAGKVLKNSLRDHAIRRIDNESA